MAAKYNVSIFTYTGGDQNGELAMAEAMVFNRGNLGMVGGVLAGYELPEEQRKYVRFYRDRFADLHRDVQNRADVAVLHGFASMAYNSDLPWQSSMLLEQTLIQARVPFDIVFDEHLRDLAKYRVLVLPDQESMSDAQVAAVREYVRRGGGLVATEDSSLFTEERRRRRNYALADLFGVDAPDYAPGQANERSAASRPVRHEAGGGRVVYLPAVRPDGEKPPTAAMTSQYWKLPLNRGEIIDAVKWAAGGELSLEVQAPPEVVAELTDQKDRVLVHLLNYAEKRGPVGGKISVSVEIPRGRRVRSASLISPDHPAQELKVEPRGNRALFSVPRLAIYGVAVLELN